MRALIQWIALAITGTLLVLAGRDFARAHGKTPPPVVVTLDAPPKAPDTSVWVEGAAQAHALTIEDGYAAWTEGDGSVRLAPMTNAGDITMFAHEFAIAGPILTRAHDVCWATTRSKLRCGAPHGHADDVATTPGSVVTMDANDARIVWTQFDGNVLEVERATGHVRTLAKTREPSDVSLEVAAAYVFAFEPTRVLRLDAAEHVVFERNGDTSHLGKLLGDRDALYLDTRDNVDGLTSILRIDKTTHAVTTLYRGYAHVALSALHGETLYGVEAPFRSAALDLESATVVTLSIHGGPLTHVRDLVIGWGGSIATWDAAFYFTHGARNPVGAPGPIWTHANRRPFSGHP